MSYTYKPIAGLILTIVLNANAAEFSFKVHDGPMDMGYITSQVQLEDQEEICQIDTGARKTVVKKLFADREAIGEEPSGGISGIGGMADLIPVESISVDEWETRDLVIRRTSIIPTDCIIGNDIFMKRNFMIDNQRNVFTTNYAPTTPTHPLLILNKKWFGFSIRIGELYVDSLFDTGAAATLVDPELIKAMPENFEFRKEIEITDGAGRKLQSAIYKLKNLIIEGELHTGINVLTYPLDSLQKELPTVRVILGFNVIRKQNWWFNFEHRQWGTTKF